MYSVGVKVAVWRTGRLLRAVSLAVLVCAVASCSGDAPSGPVVPTVAPGPSGVSIVGQNCRATPVSPDGSGPFVSTYYDIMSDGSEEVTAQVQTPVPCP